MWLRAQSGAGWRGQCTKWTSQSQTKKLDTCDFFRHPADSKSALILTVGDKLKVLELFFHKVPLIRSIILHHHLAQCIPRKMFLTPSILQIDPVFLKKIWLTTSMVFDRYTLHMMSKSSNYDTQYKKRSGVAWATQRPHVVPANRWIRHLPCGMGMEDRIISGGNLKVGWFNMFGILKSFLNPYIRSTVETWVQIRQQSQKSFLFN
jgi:hypothetical protein